MTCLVTGSSENTTNRDFPPELNIFYLVALFPRFSCFTFHTLVALETFRE